MLDKNDKKYIIRRVITYLVIAFVMFLISSCQVKAYEVNNALIQPNLLRLRTTGGNVDSSFTNNYADINLPGIFDSSLSNISLFFRTTQYFGYQNKFYQFGGHYTSTNKLNITGVSISNGSGTVIGTCTYTGNGLDNYVSWTVTCFIPSGLINTNNGNILNFETSYQGTTPQSINNINFFIDSNVVMYDNYYTTSSSELNNINNSVNNVNNSVNNVNNSVNNVDSSVNNVNNSVNNVNNSITSEDGPSNSYDFVGYLPPGPLDSILNLPLQLLNVINNKLGSSCTPLELTIPFIHETITLPCLWLYLSNNIPRLNSILTWVSVVADIYILYHYLMYTYKWVDDTLTLRENNQFGGYD